MTPSNYDEALRRLLAHEGGYVNHPADPGGPTNFGITIKEYAAFKGRNVSAAEMRALPLAEAKEIYRSKYWDRLRCDSLSSGLDYALFDFGVNSGPARAAKVLQRLCGVVPADGQMTDATLAAIAKHNARDLIARLCAERMAFLQSLKTWPVFGAGWSRRVTEVKSAALRMASAHASTKPGSTPDKAAGPLAKTARSGTVGATVAAGAAVAHETYKSGAADRHVLAIVAATLVIAAIVWLAFHWRRRGKQDASEKGADQ